MTVVRQLVMFECCIWRLTFSSGYEKRWHGPSSGAGPQQCGRNHVLNRQHAGQQRQQACGYRQMSGTDTGLWSVLSVCLYWNSRVSFIHHLDPLKVIRSNCRHAKNSVTSWRILFILPEQLPSGVDVPFVVTCFELWPWSIEGSFIFLSGPELHSWSKDPFHIVHAETPYRGCDPTRV